MTTRRRSGHWHATPASVRAAEWLGGCMRIAQPLHMSACLQPSPSTHVCLPTPSPACLCRRRAHRQVDCALHLRPPEHQAGHRAGAVWRVRTSSDAQVMFAQVQLLGASCCLRLLWLPVSHALSVGMLMVCRFGMQAGEAPLGDAPAAWRHQHAAAGRPRYRQVTGEALLLGGRAGPSWSVAWAVFR